MRAETKAPRCWMCIIISAIVLGSAGTLVARSLWIMRAETRKMNIQLTSTPPLVAHLKLSGKQTNKVFNGIEYAVERGGTLFINGDIAPVYLGVVEVTISSGKKLPLYSDNPEVISYRGMLPSVAGERNLVFGTKKDYERISLKYQTYRPKYSSNDRK